MGFYGSLATRADVSKWTAFVTKKLKRPIYFSTKHTTYHESKMDYSDPKRRKKSDKAKEKYALNGGFSQKHVRATEALLEKRSHGAGGKSNKKN